MRQAATPASGFDLDEVAAAFARGDAADAEAAVAVHVAAAIRGRRLDEAMFWQRVTFKARLLRAAHRSGGVAGE